jgi:hypothetical protein
MTTYNLLAVRKTIGAIRHRLNETGLDPAIRVRIIDRQIADLLDTLPSSWHTLLHKLLAANLSRDEGELLAGLDLLDHRLPAPSYGAAVAGTVFRLTPTDHAALFIKRKDGVQRADNGAQYPHLDSDARVWPANGDLL